MEPVRPGQMITQSLAAKLNQAFAEIERWKNLIVAPPLAISRVGSQPVIYLVKERAATDIGSGSGGGGDVLDLCTGVVATSPRQYMACLGGHTVCVSWTETTSYDANGCLQVEVSGVESEVPPCLNCCPEDDTGGSGSGGSGGNGTDCDIPFDLLRLLPLKATLHVNCIEDVSTGGSGDPVPCMDGLEIELDPTGDSGGDTQAWIGVVIVCTVRGKQIGVIINVTLQRDPTTGCFGGPCISGVVYRQEGPFLVESTPWANTGNGEPCYCPDGGNVCQPTVVSKAPLHLTSVNMGFIMPLATTPYVVCVGTVEITMP